ncbi:MAG: CRTAC1 family protein [Acidobacteriota bacterium]
MLLPARSVLSLLCLALPVSAGAASTSARAPATQAAAAPETPTETSIRLVDVAKERGLDFVHDPGRQPLQYIVETTGSGACAFDSDGDGDVDLYLVNGGRLTPGPEKPKRSPSRLYRQDDGRFTAVADATLDGPDDGWGMGCAVADLQGDGDLDLLVTHVGPDLLYLSDGQGGYTEIGTQAGVNDRRWTTSAAFADHDADGDLDLAVGAYVDFEVDGRWCKGPDDIPIVCPPMDYQAIQSRLYRNDGPAAGTPLRFTDVTKDAGLEDEDGKSLGVLFEDLTDDGRPDLFIANDTERNSLFVNMGDGRFRDRTLRAGVGLSDLGHTEASMGVDAGDLDGDGKTDLVVTNFQFEANTVYRGIGGGRWMDETDRSGVAGFTLSPLAFGIDMVDLDLDGDLDLYVANGHVDDKVEQYDVTTTHPQRDQVLENRSSGGRLVFADVSKQAITAEPLVGRGSLTFDLGDDGDLDVLVTNNGGAVQLLENRSLHADRHWLTLRLRSAAPNTEAIGALVELLDEKGQAGQRRRVRRTSSFVASMPPTVHFGLPSATKPRARLTWPDGHVEVIGPLALDRLHVIERTAPTPPPSEPTPPPSEPTQP